MTHRFSIPRHHPPAAGQFTRARAFLASYRARGSSANPLVHDYPASADERRAHFRVSALRTLAALVAVVLALAMLVLAASF